MEEIKFQKNLLGKNFNIAITDIEIPERGFTRCKTIIDNNEFYFDYLTKQGKKGISINRYSMSKILRKNFNQDAFMILDICFFMIIDAEIEKIKKERIEEKEARKKKMLSSEIPIELIWSEGSILSGYTVYDEIAEEILKGLKLTKDVSGWGLLIDTDLVKALGSKFTYQELVNYINPIIEKKEEEITIRKTIQRKFENSIIEKAKSDGKRQEISRFMDDCNDPDEECNADIVIKWAMPDGSIEYTRTHTF